MNCFLLSARGVESVAQTTLTLMGPFAAVHWVTVDPMLSVPALGQMVSPG
jgi:hypothetical protein